LHDGSWESGVTYRQRVLQDAEGRLQEAKDMVENEYDQEDIHAQMIWRTLESINESLALIAQNLLDQGANG
jgi:hypothetical protein